MVKARVEEHASHLLRIQLTERQREQLKSVTNIPLSSLALAPDEWNPTYRETWQQEPDILRVGQKIAIAYGENYQPVPDDDCVVRLPLDKTNSDEVFGTGKHPATQLSLELLESSVRGRDRVLDVGTGSGILAVAAARLGATEVLAVDTDPDAVAKARSVIRANGLEDVIELKLGSIECADRIYDLLVANIFTHVIISLAPAFRRAISPLGTLIVSGIVSARTDDVIKRVSAIGFELAEQRSLDVWQALLFTRTAD
jgi:ribosomal protein L11 methyltransferase